MHAVLACEHGGGTIRGRPAWSMCAKCRASAWFTAPPAACGMRARVKRALATARIRRPPSSSCTRIRLAWRKAIMSECRPLRWVRACGRVRAVATQTCVKTAPPDSSRSANRSLHHDQGMLLHRVHAFQSGTPATHPAQDNRSPVPENSAGTRTESGAAGTMMSPLDHIDTQSEPSRAGPAPGIHDRPRSIPRPRPSVALHLQDVPQIHSKSNFPPRPFLINQTQFLRGAGKAASSASLPALLSRGNCGRRARPVARQGLLCGC